MMFSGLIMLNEPKTLVIIFWRLSGVWNWISKKKVDILLASFFASQFRINHYINFTILNFCFSVKTYQLKIWPKIWKCCATASIYQITLNRVTYPRRPQLHHRNHRSMEQKLGTKFLHSTLQLIVSNQDWYFVRMRKLDTFFIFISS